MHDPEGSNTAKTNVLFETRKRGRANVFTGDRDTDFIIVSWVACANVLVNALRRDSAILWQVRKDLRCMRWQRSYGAHKKSLISLRILI